MDTNIIACADWRSCISFGWNQLYTWRCYTIYFQGKWICGLPESFEQRLLFINEKWIEQSNQDELYLGKINKNEQEKWRSLSLARFVPALISSLTSVHACGESSTVDSGFRLVTYGSPFWGECFLVVWQSDFRCFSDKILMTNKRYAVHIESYCVRVKRLYDKWKVSKCIFGHVYQK